MYSQEHMAAGFRCFQGSFFFDFIFNACFAVPSLTTLPSPPGRQMRGNMSRCLKWGCLRASQLCSPSQPSYSPGQSHDQVNVAATFPSVETSYSFQRPRCTYRKRCVHVLGTRQAHCVPSIMEGFVKFQRPQLREGSSEEADMGKEGLGGIL